MVIVNYNDLGTTSDYISNIKDYKSIDKIIVVDNSSTDDSYERLKKYTSDKIEIILNPKNNGYSGGNNYGIKYAESKYSFQNIIISNPDIRVSDTSIKNMIDYLNKNRDVAAVSGLIHDINDEVVSNFAWKLPTYTNILIDCFLSVKIILEKLFNIGDRYNKNKIKKGVMVVDVLSGCFFIIKSKVMREINYFDERTFLYNEENILAYKLKEKKYKQAILTNEKVVHFQGVSIDKSIKGWKRKCSIMQDSCLVYLRSYLRVSRLQQILYVVLFNIGKYERFIILNLRQLARQLISIFVKKANYSSI